MGKSSLKITDDLGDDRLERHGRNTVGMSAHPSSVSKFYPSRVTAYGFKLYASERTTASGSPWSRTHGDLICLLPSSTQLATRSIDTKAPVRAQPCSSPLRHLSQTAHTHSLMLTSSVFAPDTGTLTLNTTVWDEQPQSSTQASRGLPVC